MNWECNRCGHRVQPVNKEVKPDGMAWPAGSACSRCLNGEMVYLHLNQDTDEIVGFSVHGIKSLLESKVKFK
jgi:hypothetical protein